MVPNLMNENIKEMGWGREKNETRKDEKWQKQRNTKNITIRIKRLIINTQEK